MNCLFAGADRPDEVVGSAGPGFGEPRVWRASGSVSLGGPGGVTTAGAVAPRRTTFAERNRVSRTVHRAGIGHGRSASLGKPGAGSIPYASAALILGTMRPPGNHEARRVMRCRGIIRRAAGGVDRPDGLPVSDRRDAGDSGARCSVEGSDAAGLRTASVHQRELLWHRMSMI